MANTLVSASAQRGVPPLLTTAAFSVNRPSRPILNNTRGAISRLVFSRLKTTRIEITVTSSKPPRGKMILAASAAGRFEAPNTCNGKTRSSPTLTSK
jgi:hypothetical protein